MKKLEDAINQVGTLSAIVVNNYNNKNNNKNNIKYYTKNNNNKGVVGGKVVGCCYFWEEFGKRCSCPVVLSMLTRSSSSADEKDAFCRILEAMQKLDADTLARCDKFPLSELEVVAVASHELKIPYWYSRWWYLDFAQNGWMTTRGMSITVKNWRNMLQKWFKISRNREEIQAQYSIRLGNASTLNSTNQTNTTNQTNQTNAANNDIDAPKVPRMPVVTAHHWYECQRTCKNFRDGFCACGYHVPAVLYAPTFGVTERCARFEPVPSEWQNAWIYSCGEKFKGTEKERWVKEYFDAHPDELAEARARNELNEPTEEECVDVQRYLDEVLEWHKLSKAEQAQARKNAHS